MEYKSDKYTHDDSLKKDDIVIDNYSDRIGKFIRIVERRFIKNIHDCGIYGGNIGDEYNPVIEILLITNTKGKLIINPKSIVTRDSGYVKKLTKDYFDEKINDLKKIEEQWKKTEKQLIQV